MPKSSKQKLKILYVKDYLEEYTDDGHSVTVDQIIDHLSANGIAAERKSIYDDLAMLSSYGMDIVKVHGDKRVGYALVSRSFELPELKLLVDAVQSSKFITEKKSKTLISKIEKLTSRNEAQKLDRQVNVADRAKTENETIYYSVDCIHTALAEGKKITFRYFEWNVKKERVFRRGGAEYKVTPYSLLWDDENYYLIAKDDRSGEKRHYRVDKMTGIRLSEESADKNAIPACGVTEYSKKLFGMFGGEEELVTLRCRNALAGVMIDRFGVDTAIRKVAGTDIFEISAGVVVSPAFYSWVASFEGEVRIVSPDKTAEGYREFLKKAGGEE